MKGVEMPKKKIRENGENGNFCENEGYFNKFVGSLP